MKWYQSDISPFCENITKNVERPQRFGGGRRIKVLRACKELLMKIIKVSSHDFPQPENTTTFMCQCKNCFLIKTYNYLNGIIKLFPCFHGEKVSGTMPFISKRKKFRCDTVFKFKCEGEGDERNQRAWKADKSNCNSLNSLSCSV